MVLPSGFFGLHKFLSKDQKVVLESDGRDSMILDFVRFMNDPSGVMRAKFKTITYPNGRRTEIPVDIFIRELKFQNLQLQMFGVERESKTDFRISIGYQPWQKAWRSIGTVRTKSIDISKPDIGSLIEATIAELII